MRHWRDLRGWNDPPIHLLHPRPSLGSQQIPQLPVLERSGHGILHTMRKDKGMKVWKHDNETEGASPVDYDLDVAERSAIRQDCGQSKEHADQEATREIKELRKDT